MLTRKYAQLLNINSALYKTAQNHCSFHARSYSRKCSWLNILYYNFCNRDSMSSAYKFRFILKDFSVSRLVSAWTRSFLVNRVVKRCKNDRSVRELLFCFRSTLTPRRTLMLYGAAACKARDEEPQPSCNKNITDEDLQELLRELEGVEELSRRTLYCEGCHKRVVIDKQHPGVRYCSCKDVRPPEHSCDGWVPYMETDDVIIWRKQYKGPGLYAYKVYGRYKEVYAADFAAVQVDGAYRRAWDSAVASLSVVERQANGMHDQTVLHWEVLWPRLFANRDYVYIRRHKEYDVKSRCQIHKEGIFEEHPCVISERENVHSHAKRKSMALEALGLTNNTAAFSDHKVYVIVSRSCEHVDVPVTKNAIRVTEYWSHMVIKTLDGNEKPGMEFVLTYYDEPAVGGMPTGVAAWATGRAAPAYLTSMRHAANHYSKWLESRTKEDLPDFAPFRTEKMSHDEKVQEDDKIREQDMESSNQGPDMENSVASTQDRGTQTDGVKYKQEAKVESIPQTKKTSEHENVRQTKTEETEKIAEDGGDSSSWWRYLHPYYYFV